MEQCACVERELEKVLHRFVMYGHQSEERLDELLRSVCEIRGQLVAFGEKTLLSCIIYKLDKICLLGSFWFVRPIINENSALFFVFKW